MKFALFRMMCSQKGSLDSITSAGTPCAARRRRPNARFERGPLVVARAPRSRARRRRDPGARGRGDRAGEPGVIEVVVGQQHELDRLEGVPERLERRLERLERLGVGGPGVDERERVALEQPDVDGAEVGHRDLDPVHAAGQRTRCGIDSGHRQCLA